MKIYYLYGNIHSGKLVVCTHPWGWKIEGGRKPCRLCNRNQFWFFIHLGWWYASWRVYG